MSTDLYEGTSKFSLSFPCVYPVCPISIDHTRLYVIGDIIARYTRSCNREVVFPLGFHYSGLTAHKFQSDLNADGDNQTKRIFEEIYKCNSYVIKYLKQSPRNILDYYTYLTIQDFRKINISADYDEFYTTTTKMYDDFVLNVFEKYKKNKVLVENGDNFQLNYNDEDWKNKMFSWAENVRTIRPQEKNGLMNSTEDLSNGWDILKTEGYGTHVKDGRIIDSMHDSELLSLYDIINHVSKNVKEFDSADMKCLFDVLANEHEAGEIPENVSEVLKLMPTSVLIMEEHLKVWFIKKLYLESLILEPDYRTQNYFVLGLGMRNGKRMSSSRGTAILLQDLIRLYGAIKARIILLMVGGHPSNFYNYDENIANEVETVFQSFKNKINTELVELLKANESVLNRMMGFQYKHEIEDLIKDAPGVEEIFKKCEKMIIDGNFKQCLLEIMSSVQKQMRKYGAEDKIKLLYVINYFFEILIGVNITEI